MLVHRCLPGCQHKRWYICTSLCNRQQGVSTQPCCFSQTRLQKTLVYHPEQDRYARVAAVQEWWLCTKDTGKAYLCHVTCK